MGETTKKLNHLFPYFHIKKWIESGGKIYDKHTEKIRDIQHTDFAEKLYYSNGKPDQTLEDKISKFESVIGEIIKKVDNAQECVLLTGKELELLKLYVVLCANRHHYSIELIKSDESDVYRSNNFIFGIHTVKCQEDAIKVVETIIDDFDKINALNKDEHFIVDDGSKISPEYIKLKSSFTTAGLHLVIMRNEASSMMVSDCVAITENTMDSEYLYTYVPISPKTALLLVKSKYYFDEQHFENTKIYFSALHHAWKPDTFISECFGAYKGEFDCEKKLFCSYSKIRSAVHVKETYINQNHRFTVKIETISKIIVKMFNLMYYEDGKKILFINDNDLKYAKLSLDSRKINIG